MCVQWLLFRTKTSIKQCYYEWRRCQTFGSPNQKKKTTQSPMGSAGSNINGATTVENSLTFPQKIKHRIISIWPRNWVIWPIWHSTPRYIAKRIESRYSNKNFYMNVQSSIIHNWQMRKQSKWWMDRLNAVISIKWHIIQS